MALGAWTGGLLLFVLRPRLAPALRAVERLGERIGPEHLYSLTLTGLNRLSDRIHDIEIRDLRSRVAAVLVPAAALVALGVAITPFDGAYRIGELPIADLPLVIALAVSAMAAVVTTLPRQHVPLILALSGVGYALAVAYSLMGSADVALVAVLIETVFALLFVAVFAIVPREVLEEETRRTTKRNRKIRDISIATVSGVVMTLVVWGAFSRPIPENGMAERLIENVEEAHGKDAVTVILADFRGLDTAVEVTVVAAAMLGVLTLLRRRGSRT
jgi:multicomponent Na+:H+ antiporter subunit A